MTVVNRRFGEDPGCSGPAKELPARAPLADLEKAATRPAIAPSGCGPCHTLSALAQFAQLTWTRG